MSFPRLRSTWFIVLAVVLISLVNVSPAYAQWTVKGRVIDSADRQPMTGAQVLLLRESDSVRVGVVTRKDGSFVMQDVGVGRWSAKVSFVGYRPLTRTVNVTDADIDLGTIVMAVGTNLTDEITVTGKAVSAVQKGDTVEYNAAAFKVNKAASAEDLVQKMPGVTMQDGRVQAQGEQVQQVLVDGRQFFGNDPNVALRNLPAEMIESIQVFDQASDQNQFSRAADANARKTLNIVTKKSMRNGAFGRAFAGYGGEDSRYKAGATVNVFDSTRRYTILAQSNNVNEQNFAIEDIVGAFGGGGGRGGMMRRMAMMAPGGGGGGRPMFRGGGGGMSDFFVDQRNGITTTHAGGINYSDMWGESINVTASNFFNYSDNVADQTLFRQYTVPTQFGNVYDERSDVSSSNINNRFNARLDIRLDSAQSLLWSPRFTLQQNEGVNDVLGLSRSDANVLGSTRTAQNTDYAGMTFGNDLLYRLRFAKPGRTLAVNANISYTANDGTNDLFSSTTSTVTSIVDTLEQRSTLDQGVWTINPSVTFTEPFDTLSSLAVQASTNIQTTLSDRLTNRASETDVYNILDTAQSNTLRSTYAVHQVSPTYRYGDRDFGFELGVTGQLAELDNEQRFPFATTVRRTFWNVLPNANLRYQISKDANLRLFYRARTSAPSADQLQDAVTTSNPLQLTAGDPNLRQDLTHTLFTRYSANDVASGTTFFALLRGEFTYDYIANSVTIAERDTAIAEGIILPQGGQLTRPVNLDGYVSLRAFATYGFPVEFLSSNLNLFGSVTWTRTPGLVNGLENIATTPSANAGFALASNISEGVDFTISTNYTFSSVSNSVLSERNTDYINGSSRLRLSWEFIPKLTIVSDLVHTLTSGYSEGYDQSIILWNAALAWRFLADDRGELRLSANDILQRNTAISRSVSESSVDDTRATVLQRWAVLMFTYDLRVF